jgi:hypothetical protein
VVHWLAARAIFDPPRLEIGGAAPTAERQRVVEGESAGIVEFGTGVAVHAGQRYRDSASIRRRVSQHWLRTVHGEAGRRRRPALRTLGRSQAGVWDPHHFDASGIGTATVNQPARRTDKRDASGVEFLSLCSNKQPGPLGPGCDLLTSEGSAMRQLSCRQLKNACGALESPG